MVRALTQVDHAVWMFSESYSSHAVTLPTDLTFPGPPPGFTGEVFCYTDESKPPIGQGLNTDAEVTLYGIYKVRDEGQG